MKSTNCLIVGLMLLCGCALFHGGTEAEKVADVQRLSYAAGSVGTRIALIEHPEWRIRLESAYTNLDAMVTAKIVTGTLLHNWITALPIKELKSKEAVIAIEGAVVLYDVSVGDRVNIEGQPYAYAAAIGVRDGMKAALWSPIVP